MFYAVPNVWWLSNSGYTTQAIHNSINFDISYCLYIYVCPFTARHIILNNKNLTNYGFYISEKHKMGQFMWFINHCTYIRKLYIYIYIEVCMCDIGYGYSIQNQVLRYDINQQYQLFILILGFFFLVFVFCIIFGKF